MNLINGTMRYIAYYLLLLAMKNIQIEGNTCLTDLPDHKPRYIHYNGRPMNFTLEISDRVSHRLTTEILKILLQDVLGYQNIMIVKDLQHMDTSSWENLHEKYSKGPDVLINLETLVNPETGYKQLSEFMTECGNIGPPGRYGWFIPEQLYEMFPGSDHWKYFKNPLTAQNFDIARNEDQKLLHKYSFNSKNQKYICETNNCKDGYYIPQHCQGNQSCAVMLTSYPNTTNFIISQIDELKLYIKILWLGNNLRNVVDKLTNIYKDQNVNKSIIFLEWSPGIFTTELEKFNVVSIPNCDYFKNPSSSGCQYEMTQTIKTSWKELQNVAWPAFELINKMHFDINTYKNLLQLYNQNGNSSFQKTACMWMKNNKPIWSTWLSTRSDKKNLYVGGIFPITGSLYNAYGIVIAAKMAENAINANSTILADYQLNLLVNDGMCKADMVMKTFIDYIYHNTYENLIGVLGPACSETVEPLAGVSKHYSTLVISYSAEGSSFSDRSRYPYFFRTIGENEHYKQVYLNLFQRLEWHRIAALTEDGQKYTEYISSMGDLFQANNINFIANMKFPRESKESSLTRYLEDLKGKHSKIIIADIYDGIARIVMCQAYKLDMTAKQGYVWFLPAWLPTKWYNTTHYNKYFNETVDCSIDIMLEAINGHFSLNHAAFGPSDSIMQENISVQVWRDKYKNHVDKWYNTSTNREFNPYLALNNNDFTSEYAGYAYDAVWIYALAIEELLKKHPESLSGIHSNDVTLKLVDIISQIDFNGVSGKIKFYGGPSRFSVINIIQWINEKSVVVGSFHPNISTVRPEVIGGILDLSKSNIVWLTPDGLIPEDGTLALNSCLLEPVATYLQISCENAVILVNVLSFTVLGIFLTIMVILLKRRYDKKIKMNEEYMKYMKAIGFDKNNGMNLTNLDKWETARECVVLNRKLGEGAFGTVFGGEAILSEGKGWVAVAVKTLKVGSDRDEKLDFLSEAESMKRFEHKNIVKLLGVCTKNEPFYTIMEFMLYGDLKTYLLARRHLINEPYTDEKEEISGKKLTSMALDIARALSYLAELKYVHRDVACRNCLVNAQRVVKLGDFGMTRLIFENDYYRFSRKGMLPVRWMAPESLGLGIFTPASDVWSFAVLLYEIITFGSFPFQGLSNNEVLEHVKIGRTITIPSGIKPQLEGLMKSCWNLDYRTRPHASEIAEFLANSPRLLSPCLDVPLASVEIDFSGELDIPEVLNRHTNPNVIEEENDISDVSVLNSLHFDNPSYITADLNTNLGAAKKAKYNKHTYEDKLTTGKCDIEEIVPFV